MITRTDIEKVLATYDLNKLTIVSLGGHSALDVCRGAKRQGFRTLVVAQKGRQLTYERYYRARDKRGVVDDVIVLDNFRDITNADVQKEINKRNGLVVQNRYFWVYCDYDKVENDFRVPILGSRGMVRLEERDVPNNQYYLLKTAGIRIPEIFKKPEDIYKLAIVKVSEAKRGYERAFFFADSPTSYYDRSREMVASGVITEQSLRDSVIEEYIVGAQVNFNYYFTNLTGELELMGTDMRRQTNLDGLLRLPAPQQHEVLNYLKVKMIETGHVAVTVKESLLEKAFDIGEKFVRTSQQKSPPGIIGPFALQGAVAAEEGREEIVIFDVSMRIPGSPGTMATPYSGYLYGESMSYGDRIALDVKDALSMERLKDIVT